MSHAHSNSKMLRDRLPKAILNLYICNIISMYNKAFVLILYHSLKLPVPNSSNTETISVSIIHVLVQFNSLIL